MTDTAEGSLSATNGKQFSNSRLRRFEWKLVIAENHEQVGAERADVATIRSSEAEQTIASTETIAESVDEETPTSIGEGSTAKTADDTASESTTAASTARSEKSRAEPGAESTADDRAATDTTGELADDGGDAGPLDAHRTDLTADDSAVRREAVQALADAADGTVPERAVIDALAERVAADDDTEVRVTACEALGRIGADAGRTRSVLKDHRLDPEGVVSRAASRALRSIDDQ